MKAWKRAIIYLIGAAAVLAAQRTCQAAPEHVSLVSITTTSTSTRIISGLARDMYRDLNEAVAEAEHLRVELEKCDEETIDLRVELTRAMNARLTDVDRLEVETELPWWVPWSIAGAAVVGIVAGVWATAEIAGAR